MTKHLSIFCLLLTAPVAAQEQVTKIEYVRTTTTKGATGEPVVTERGTYWITRDGRHRVERSTMEDRTAEIVRWRDRQRIALNLRTREAVVGSLRGPSITPPSLIEPCPVPGGAPSAMQVDSQEITPLGKKAVGDIELQGHGQTIVMSGGGQQVVHHMELWAYHFPSDPRILPIIIEERFEDEREIVERKIVSVGTDNVSPSFFTVPRGFTILKR